MTGANTDPSPVLRAVQISGISVDISGLLEHSLLIDFNLGGTRVGSVPLKKQEKHHGTRSLETPLDLGEGPILTIHVQEKHRRLRFLQKDETLAYFNLSSNDILLGLGQDPSAPIDPYFQKYRLRIANPRLQIWLNVTTSTPLSEVAQTYPLDKSQESTELKELKEYLLDGITMVLPRATECLPGTRDTILADITTKTNDPDSGNILWIRGAPGSGKSSISLTTKSRLIEEGRLITYFRFDRNDTSITTSIALWRQIAYDLGCRLPSIRPQLLRQLRDHTVDLDSSLAVFTHLVEVPLSKLTIPLSDHPLVIIIDALDECGGLEARSSADRKSLLQTIQRCHNLPKYVKLIVTSREDGDIQRFLSRISTPIDILSGNIITEKPNAEVSISASRDIYTFLEDRFRQIGEPIPSIPSNWPDKGVIAKMVRRAAGNFMWATAATNFIDWSLDPQNQLVSIMSESPESLGMGSLYSLYYTILEISFRGSMGNTPDAEVLRVVLGTVVLAQRPFQDSDFTKLPTTKPVNKATIELIRDRLHSVLAQGPDLRFVHKSFDDFLLSEECPLKYRIISDDSQHLLTKLCLTTMTTELNFNMCSLETSYLRNVDVPDIETKVANGISGLLSYSCCFWAEHLALTPLDEELMDAVKDIVLDKLLYWFEAMSLLKEMNRVSSSLLLLLNWSHPFPDEGFRDFIRDARRFVGAFIHPMVQSAPHIYISALPFAPEHSFIARTFLSRFPNILALSLGRSSDWSPCVFISEHHKASARSVAFSPDEKCFVSGSYDGSFCVSDSETGNLLSGPFSGLLLEKASFDPDGQRVWVQSSYGEVRSWDIETGDIYRVFRPEIMDHKGMFTCRYSYSGRYVVSWSTKEGTLTLWNSETGEKLRDLPQMSIDVESTWIEYSSDGRYAAIGGRDGTTVKLWNLVDGSEIRGPSHSQPHLHHGSCVTALSFAIDGYFVASASNDGTILIWSVETGNIVGCPLSTGKSPVHKIAYSYKHTLLVSASDHPVGTVLMIWNSSTRELILGPLEGHTSNINQLSLSQDSRKALSASSDGTVRMWDLGRRGILPTTYATGVHPGCEIYRVAFSPCAKKLASLGTDNTIGLWDVNNGTALFRSSKINHGSYSNIIYSPDGSRIMTFGSSPELRAVYLGMWDTDTGESVLYEDFRDENEDDIQDNRVAFRSIDQRLITCSRNGVVRVWNFEDGAIVEEAVVETIPHVGTILAFSPDGSFAIVSDPGNMRVYLWSTPIRRSLCPTLTVDHEHNLSRDCTPIPPHYVAFSLNGRFFAVAVAQLEREFDPFPRETTLRVWDAQNGTLVPSSYLRFKGDLNSVSFWPDDCHIAVSYSICSPFSHSDSTAIQIWNFWAGSHAGTSRLWKRHGVEVRELTFSPDGEQLATVTDDGQIKIWDTAELLRRSESSFGFLGVGKVMEDGWVIDEDGKLLFWVPKDRRSRLVWPGGEVTIGGTGIPTELDPTRFRYGERWTECFGEEN